jgi:type II secretory pathway pseudopilin PulG
MKKSGIVQQKRKTSLAGFTLAETAVVMLIAGIVVGGIWAVSGTVWQNHKVNTTSQEILLVVQNVRDSYVGASQLPGNFGSDITETLDADNLFPIEMRRCPITGTCSTPNYGGGPGNTPIDHIFNSTDAKGSFRVSNAVQANHPPYFRLRLLDLDAGPCIGILLKAPVEDATLASIGIGTNLLNNGVMGTNGTSTAIDYRGVALNNGVTFPLNPTTASLWCNAGPGANEVDIDFKLH